MPKIFPVYAYKLVGYADTASGADELVSQLRLGNENDSVKDFVVGDPVDDPTEYTSDDAMTVAFGAFSPS